MAKEMADLIEAKRVEVASGNQVSAKETLELLASVARNPSHKDHLRALEIMLKVHGLLSDKLQVTVDRKQLLSELDSQLARLVQPAAPPSKLLNP